MRFRHLSYGPSSSLSSSSVAGSLHADSPVHHALSDPLGRGRTPSALSLNLSGQDAAHQRISEHQGRLTLTWWTFRIFFFSARGRGRGSPGAREGGVDS